MESKQLNYNIPPLHQTTNCSVSERKLPSKHGKYFSLLNQVIWDIIQKRKINFTQFSQMFHEALIPIEDSFIKRRACINLAVRMITGMVNLDYNQFKFIIEQVLCEDIPDDPEIEHIKNLRSRGRDLRGHKAGRLTVVECLPQSDTDRGKLYWKCKCKCGNETIVRGTHLTDNSVMSCGCFNRERSREQLTTHGKSKTKTYKTWDCMKQRCYNPNDNNYPNYGGRGIRICDRWLESFTNFYDDMGDRPKHKTIDRIDVDGNYELGNCKWATPKEQCNNTRNTVRFDDNTPVSVWADENNIPQRIARRGCRKGLSKEQILEKFNRKLIENK